MRKAVIAALLIGSATARAQGVDRRYAEEPTAGLALPLAPLAGEHDARTVSVNPGGLALLRGSELALVLGLEDHEHATSTGQGLGAYAAGSVGGGLLPRLALGLGFEWLRPSRTQLAPDPGEPFRFTLATATSLGKDAGLGVSWHHFFGEGALEGVDTFDVGLSWRLGTYLAIGATVRDLATAPVGGAPVQRRYELESVVRPLATDRLELAFGGRIGETRLDLDGWLRVSALAARGVTVHAGLETRTLHALVTSPMGRREDTEREVRGMLGLELSFGRAGVTAIGTGLRDGRGDDHLLGGQLVLRSSAVGPASVLAPSARLERVELRGAIGQRQLTSLVARLRSIARDPAAKGLVVTFDGVSGGWATLEELRHEILGVRKAGKRVFAYMVSGTGRDYFIATAADRIYVDPAGGVRLVGLAATTMYFKGAFEQLGIEPQFEKIAELKTAPETFTRTGPSEAAVTMYEGIYDSLWDRWLTEVATARKLSKEELQLIVDHGPYTAGDLAKDQKLVDAVADPDEVAQLVAREMGGALPVARPSVTRPDRWARPAIAVIYAEGDIVDGKSRTVPLLGQRLVGSETVIAAIKSARHDPRIGAIILRIDSPGGSALASELIAREVFATRGTKPILCSFGDVAASGGYFIAAGCDLIFAEPMTLTGSIGIFYGKFDVSALASKLGISTETYKRGQRADAESMFRPYTEEERAALQHQLRYMYGRFIGAVAQGRGMTTEAVDAVGRGRVFTAMQAQPLQLVDRLGGLSDVIDEAKRRMGLDLETRVELVELPNVPPSLLATLANLVGAGGAQDQTSITELPVLRELLEAVPASVLVAPQAPQARLPFELAE